MSERDPDAGHSARLLRGLVWAGVLLAPMAAAIVLLGHSSGSVRFAVLLIAVSVVLIGASVLIRSDPVLQRMHVEDRVAEEVDALRAEFARGGLPRLSPEKSGFFGDEPIMPPGRPAPSSASASASASVPPAPRQRGTAMPPGPPRATAAVQYGRPDSLDGDFGASDGYRIPHAMPTGSVYGGSPRGGTYGRSRDREYEEYGPGQSTGDPGYRAKRHRPSANDTNVGTYEDFAAYDERYVHYGRGRR